MAEKHVANAESAWTAICIAPDCCKVGKDVVPFDSVRNLSTYMVASPNVYARGTKVYPTGMGKIQGVDSDAGSGLVSLSALGSGRVDIMTDSTTVRVNGSPAARHDTPVLMNVGPGGPNTVGKLVTSQGAAGNPAKDKKLPCNDPPETSKALEELQSLKDKLKSIDPSQLDEYVRFGDASKGLDGLIAKIDVQNQGGLSAAGNYGAQASRAVLGFGKDIVLGLGNLLYTAAKHANPAGMIHSQIDALTLAEHIRLGNICLESVKQAAKAAGHELAKPVTDAWDKGNYVEAVTRGGLEVASLLLVVGDLAKLGQGAKAAEAAKAAQTARAAEAARAAPAIRAAVPVTETVGANGKKIFGTLGWDGVRIQAKSLRELFLGRTPGKASRTGREVIDRMRSEGKIREVDGVTEFKASNNEWYPLENADMAHKTDAVTWWNETGRQYGAKSPEVRDWMLDARNYELDHYSLNRSAGASLGETYLPPLTRGP